MMILFHGIAIISAFIPSSSAASASWSSFLFIYHWLLLLLWIIIFPRGVCCRVVRRGGWVWEWINVNYSFFFLFSSFLWSEFQIYACPLALLFIPFGIIKDGAVFNCVSCMFPRFFTRRRCAEIFYCKISPPVYTDLFYFWILECSLSHSWTKSYLPRRSSSFNRNKVSFPTSTRHHQPQSQPQPQQLSHWQQVISELGSTTGRFLFCILDYCHLMIHPKGYN